MERRIVVVANRLPVAWDEESGQWNPSPGGLVSALTPILQKSNGTWVGWSGVPDHGISPFEHAGINQHPVDLTEDEYLGFYVGFCNGTLWPLYHDFVRTPEYHRHWWRAYREVNRKFASAALDALEPGDVAWIQDYQLQLVPRILRERGNLHRIGFYLHIPFPAVELFSTLPWRTQVLEGLLGSDVIAFQSAHSRDNFATTATRLLGAEVQGENLMWDDREVRLQVVPIGIDTSLFEDRSRSSDVAKKAEEIREQLGQPEVVILGVDRLDYTKGIDQRMLAFQTLLERRPELVGKVVLVQVAVPSREDVAAYVEIRENIEGLVGRINGDLAEIGRPPIHYLYRSLPFDELIAYYRAADIMLVTPLRDGMNLVAKEYVAVCNDNAGVLILSEFAGAAEQLHQAMVVNPYDLDGLAHTLGRAIDSKPREANRTMRDLRQLVADNDVYWWAEQCLEALGL